MNTQKPIRIVIADEQARVRSALRLLMDQDTHYTVLAEASRADELVETVKREAIDLVLVDWNLPPYGGTDLLKSLREARDHLVIIVLSGRPESRQSALAAGADAYVSKNDPPEQLLSTLNSIWPTGLI